MSIFQKVRTLILAHTNDLLDKAIDENSIPVMKQYVRDLEDAISKTKHEAAVAAASVTTLTGQANDLQKSIDLDTQRAKAFLAKDDQGNARIAAGRIHDAQTELQSLNTQIEAAKENSSALDKSCAQLDAKHQEIMSKLRILESQERSAQSLEQATSSLKQASAIISNGSNVNVDDLSQRITARSNVAREEFNRTVGELEPPSDPLKDAAVDDILAGLKAEK